MAIAFDVDDTLLKSHRAQRIFIEEYLPKHNISCNKGILSQTGNWEAATGIPSLKLEQIYLQFFCSEHYPKEIPAIPGAREVFQSLTYVAKFLVTARPQETATDTMHTLERALDCSFVDSCFGFHNRKQEAFRHWPDIKFFIDDSPDEARAVAQHDDAITVILFPKLGRTRLPHDLPHNLIILKAEKRVTPRTSIQEMDDIYRQAWQEIKTIIQPLFKT